MTDFLTVCWELRWHLLTLAAVTAVACLVSPGKEKDQ